MSVSDGSRGYLRGRLQLVFPPNYLYTDMKGGQMARRCREAWDGRTTSLALFMFLCVVNSCSLLYASLCFILIYGSPKTTNWPSNVPFCGRTKACKGTLIDMPCHA